MSLNVTVGCDPEVFVFDKNNTPISAHKWIPGDKKNPHKVKDGAVQLDGTAAEFNIDPCSTKEEFTAKVKSVLLQVKSFIPEGYTLVPKPAVFYPESYFKKLPDFTKELGCDPDFNAFANGSINPRPNASTNMRTGSGHIHIGWTKDADTSNKSHLWDCCTVIKNFDWLYTSFSLLWDNDKNRQKLYGKPGAFRPKSYGAEYRTPSNAWLAHECLYPFLFDLAVLAVKMTEQGRVMSYSASYPVGLDTYHPKYFITQAEMTIKHIFRDQLKLPTFPYDEMKHTFF